MKPWYWWVMVQIILPGPYIRLLKPFFGMFTAAGYLSGLWKDIRVRLMECGIGELNGVIRIFCDHIRDALDVIPL